MRIENLTRPEDDNYPGEDPADYPALACHECGGTGEVTGDDDIDRPCPECDGTGWATGADFDIGSEE